MPALNSVTTPSRGNPPDPVAVVFREPQVAVGAGRDAVGVRAGGDAGAELGDDAGRGDPPDPVAATFREPQVAVGAGGDAAGPRRRDAGAELGDDAVRGDPPDPVAVDSVNHRLPSGPAVMPIGSRAGA